MPYNEPWMTLIGTPLFSRLWPDYRDEDERGAFCAWLASYADAGDVLPGSGGCPQGALVTTAYGQTLRRARHLLLLRAQRATLAAADVCQKRPRQYTGHILRDIRKEIDHG